MFCNLYSCRQTIFLSFFFLFLVLKFIGNKQQCLLALCFIARQMKILRLLFIFFYLQYLKITSFHHQSQVNPQNLNGVAPLVAGSPRWNCNTGLNLSCNFTIFLDLRYPLKFKHNFFFLHIGHMTCI